MRVLVACEFSGTVRDAFIAAGHDALSCDLQETQSPGPHYCGDVFDVLGDGWDLLIAHPPCTYLTVAANKWMKPEWAWKYPTRPQDREAAVSFFMAMYNAPVERVCVENPICIMSTRFRKPDQVVQPWMFGHGETKATCLWLKNLPKLKPTNIVEGRVQRVWLMPPGPDRWKERSRTFEGIAKAMAIQWGNPVYQTSLFNG